MLATLSAVLVAATAAAPYPEVIPHSEAEARARACRFVEVEVTYEESLEFDVLTVSDPHIDEAQIDCLARAMDETAYITVVPTEHMTRLTALNEALARPRLIPQMVASLRESGFGLPPPYDQSATTAEEYAMILEAHCGPDAAGALSSSYGPNSFSPSWSFADGLISEGRFAAVRCLQASAFVANFPLFFVGNEKAAPE